MTEIPTEPLPKSNIGGGVFRKEMKNKPDRSASRRDQQEASSMISIHKIKISGYIFHSA